MDPINLNRPSPIDFSIVPSKYDVTQPQGNSFDVYKHLQDRGVTPNKFTDSLNWVPPTQPSSTTSVSTPNPIKPIQAPDDLVKQNIKQNIDNQYGPGGDNSTTRGNAITDIGTRLLSGAKTFGGSVVGDAIQNISPDAANTVSKYTGGLVSPTPQSELVANRTGNWNSRVNSITGAVNAQVGGEMIGGVSENGLKNTINEGIQPVKDAINQTKNAYGQRVSELDPHITSYDMPTHSSAKNMSELKKLSSMSQDESVSPLDILKHYENSSLTEDQLKTATGYNLDQLKNLENKKYTSISTVNNEIADSDELNARLGNMTDEGRRLYNQYSTTLAGNERITPLTIARNMGDQFNDPEIVHRYTPQMNRSTVQGEAGNSISDNDIDPHAFDQVNGPESSRTPVQSQSNDSHNVGIGFDQVDNINPTRYAFQSRSSDDFANLIRGLGNDVSRIPQERLDRMRELLNETPEMPSFRVSNFGQDDITGLGAGVEKEYIPMPLSSRIGTGIANIKNKLGMLDGVKNDNLIPSIPYERSMPDELLGHLFKNEPGTNSVSKINSKIADTRTALDAASPGTYVTANSLSDDSYPLSMYRMSKLPMDKYDVFQQGTMNLNRLGYLQKAGIPDEDVARYINQFNSKLNFNGRVLPKAKADVFGVQVPRLIIRKK